MPRKGSNAKHALDEARIAERRHRVATLYLAGKPQYEIARLLGVQQPCISGDLAALRVEWTANALVDFDERKAVECARLDKIEAEAWEAWERSQRDRESHQVKKQYALRNKEKKRKPGQPSRAKFIQVGMLDEKKRQGQVGNPAFLERVSWCVEMRLRLFGLLQSDKSASVNITQINWADLTAPPSVKYELEAQLMAEAAQLPPPPAPADNEEQGTGNGQPR